MPEHPGHYHLTLTHVGRPVLHGWWHSETTARRKFTNMVGEHGRDNVRITLVDEDTGATLTTWPDEA